jgi:hypothetical protein
MAGPGSRSIADSWPLRLANFRKIDPADAASQVLETEVAWLEENWLGLHLLPPSPRKLVTRFCLSLLLRANGARKESRIGGIIHISMFKSKKLISFLRHKYLGINQFFD